ncbi:MAG TPA: shikimate kinase [Chitinophagaceae bacterium]|nr:shikimate kinase [Chitinophagaceae bacterium]
MTSGYQRIFLIGFMGSGKNYWGKLWSENAGFEFVDIDELIEREKEKTIAEIFAEDGEDHFRNLETIALRSLGNKSNIIIASGGGTPCFNDNISWMNENGTSVYLQSSPENILKRLVSEKEKRPLIKNLQDEELLFYITEKIKEREFFYSKAEIILKVDDLPQNYIPEFLNV